MRAKERAVVKMCGRISQQQASARYDDGKQRLELECFLGVFVFAMTFTVIIKISGW